MDTSALLRASLTGFHDEKVMNLRCLRVSKAGMGSSLEYTLIPNSGSSTS